eukprot:1133652-Pelagomonas_calceolata.AAC.1
MNKAGLFKHGHCVLYILLLLPSGISAVNVVPCLLRAQRCRVFVHASHGSLSSVFCDSLNPSADSCAFNYCRLSHLILFCKNHLIEQIFEKGGIQWLQWDLTFSQVVWKGKER